MNTINNTDGGSTNDNTEPEEEKSFFQIVIHSFFIIPFLIAVFCILLFTAMSLLTRENRTAYDYLADVKTGGLTKRWQAAFELSKILANPKLIPDETRFINELILAFKESKHDDNRVKQYLALAMGRTGRAEFIKPIREELTEEKEENLPALIYALGMLKDLDTAADLIPYASHQNARIRSITVAALGTIGNPDSIKILQEKLFDREPNVQWGAALSLALMGDESGKEILGKMMDRDYLEQFKEIDPEEQNYLILSAIEATKTFNDPELDAQIKNLSQTDPSMKVRSAALERLN